MKSGSVTLRDNYKASIFLELSKIIFNCHIVTKHLET